MMVRPQVNTMSHLLLSPVSFMLTQGLLVAKQNTFVHFFAIFRNNHYTKCFSFSDVPYAEY